MKKVLSVPTPLPRNSSKNVMGKPPSSRNVMVKQGSSRNVNLVKKSSNMSNSSGTTKNGSALRKSPEKGKMK